MDENKSLNARSPSYKKMEKIKFTDTIFYRIEKSARYINLMSKEFFEKTHIPLTPDEFRALDTLIYNPQICQRDLAKLILRDRVYTGRVLNSLETKGFVIRTNDIKNNRLVRIPSVTEKGVEVYESCLEKLEPKMQNVFKRFSKEQMNELKHTLDLFENAISSEVVVEV